MFWEFRLGVARLSRFVKTWRIKLLRDKRRFFPFGGNGGPNGQRHSFPPPENGGGGEEKHADALFPFLFSTLSQTELHLRSKMWMCRKRANSVDEARAYYAGKSENPSQTINAWNTTVKRATKIRAQTTKKEGGGINSEIK